MRKSIKGTCHRKAVPMQATFCQNEETPQLTCYMPPEEQKHEAPELVSLAPWCQSPLHMEQLSDAELRERAISMEINKAVELYEFKVNSVELW